MIKIRKKNKFHHTMRNAGWASPWISILVVSEVSSPVLSTSPTGRHWTNLFNQLWVFLHFLRGSVFNKHEGKLPWSFAVVKRLSTISKTRKCPPNHMKSTQFGDRILLWDCSTIVLIIKGSQVAQKIESYPSKQSILGFSFWGEVI